MIYGYARVSTDAQDLAGQLEQLTAAGCVKILREKISGATAERPELKKLIKGLEAGDVVIVTAVDRLSRDTRDLLNILYDIKAAGAGFRSLAEPMVDTTSELADVVLAVLGLAAKLHRKRILENTAAGQARAKAAGVKFGRKPKLTAHQRQEALHRLNKGEESPREIARSYNVSHQTIWRLKPR